MKVLVLGGAGDMAQVALKELGREEEVCRVTIADMHLKKAESLALERGEKFQAAKVDGMDHNGLVGLMRQHDVVLGYIGPFYIFEQRMAKAAIETGINYVSICDDYDAYLEVINLDREAKERGVKVLTGFGNSPGITQMLAKKGYLSMERPQRINICWAAGSNEPIGEANLIHFFHIFNGTTLQWLGGKETKVRTGEGKKIVEFPEPIGKIPVYYTGHAESVSIPRNLGGLEEVTLHGGVHPPYIINIVKFFSRLGLLANHNKRRITAKIISRIQGFFKMGGADKSVFRIDVYGENRSRRDCHHYYTGVGHMASITSIPAVTAALWVTEGKFANKSGGVYSPERLLDDPEAFLQELTRRGVEMHYYEQ
jgi:lysine 6-dehydrogenase